MSDESVLKIVLDDKEAVQAISDDEGQRLIDYIEDLQDITGATRLKITIEAFK